jgi:ribonuclease E
LVKKPEESEQVIEVVSPVKKDVEQPVLKGFAAPTAPAPAPAPKAAPAPAKSEPQEGLLSKLGKFFAGLFASEKEPEAVKKPEPKGRRSNQDNRRQGKKRRRPQRQDNRKRSNEEGSDKPETRAKKDNSQGQDNRQEKPRRNQPQKKAADETNQAPVKKERKVEERRQRRGNRKRVRVQKPEQESQAITAQPEVQASTKPEAVNKESNKPAKAKSRDNATKQSEKKPAQAKPAKAKNKHQVSLRPEKAMMTVAKRRLIAKLAASAVVADEVEIRYPESDAKFEQEHEHLAPAVETIDEVLHEPAVTESKEEIIDPVVEPNAEAEPVVVETAKIESAEAESVDTDDAVENDSVAENQSESNEKPVEQPQIEAEVKEEVSVDEVKQKADSSEAPKVAQTIIGFASAPMAKPAQVESGNGQVLTAMVQSERADVSVSGRPGGSSSATNSASSGPSKTI